MIIVVQRAARFFAAQSHVHALRVGEINIGPSVAIKINQSDAAAHRLHNVFLFGAGKVIEFDARRIGDVRELRQRSICRRTRWRLAETIHLGKRLS